MNGFVEGLGAMLKWIPENLASIPDLGCGALFLGFLAAFGVMKILHRIM